VPAWSFRKSARGRDARFSVQFWSLLPCPFNYGCAPDLPADDGEGLDVIVIGRRLARGSVVTVRPSLRVCFIDLGLVDDKLVARLDGRSLGCFDHLSLRLFFSVYTVFKRARYLLQGRGRATTGVTAYAPM
jgi:inorganic pyrophosphatase